MDAVPNKAAGCVLALAIVAGVSEAGAQAGAAQPKPSRSMASLMAEGYQVQDIRLFPDKIWMRKPGSNAVAFICDRGRIGSPAFEAYRNRQYDEISCSPAQ